MIVPTPASIAVRYGAKMHAPQGGFVDLGVALVELHLDVLAVALVAEGGCALLKFARLGAGAAVADKMLGACHDGQRIVQPFALQTVGHRFAQFADQIWILGKTFVGPSPAFVARDSDAGCERPLDSRRPDFVGRHAAHLFHQFRVARATQADVVRKDHRADHVVVAVDAVDAVEDRDAQPRLERPLLAGVVGISPSFEAVAIVRVGTAAAEHGTDVVLLDVFGMILEVAQLGLRHLADLLLERHLLDDRADLLIVLRVRLRLGRNALRRR